MHLSYIFSKELLLYFEKWNFFKKLLLFQEATFQAEKKKISEKIPYISGNGSFWTQNLNKFFLYLLEITCLMGLDCRNNVQVQSPVTLMPHGEKIEATGPLR